MSLVLKSNNREEEKPAPEVIRCAFEPCQYPAKIRLYRKGGTGFMDVCINCYDKVFLAEAKRYVEKKGLRSVADKMAFRRSHGAGVKQGHEKDWAMYLRARYMAGKPLSLLQFSMASEALNEKWDNGECRAVSKEAA